MRKIPPHASGVNFSALTPLDFLDRTVETTPYRTAVIWRDRAWNYAEFAGIVSAMMTRLEELGVGEGDVVAVMSGNRPEMLAAHYAIPALGATVNALNTRLDAEVVDYILAHSGAKIVLADPAAHEIVGAAARASGLRCLVFDETPLSEDGLSVLDAPAVFECRLAERIRDEFQPIALNYTSGTTNRPKGVVLAHRGAYLNCLGNVISLGFDAQTVYLWTLPMFHVNGWGHTWAVTAVGGTHVCLDKVVPDDVFNLIDTHQVTHLACAPVVLYMLLNDPAKEGRDPSQTLRVVSGGAAPTSDLIAQMDDLGFEFIHLYGLTECFGPETIQCIEPENRGLSPKDRAALLARQGVRHITANRLRVVGGDGRDVPADGETLGEVVLRGNTLMSGYHGSTQETEHAFAGGVFHTGDLAVRHDDNRIEIRDRAKDLIISGGENISSLEVESALHKHPDVLLAAVVAAPDEKWGEIPCAFVEIAPGSELSAEVLRQFCRANLAHFKVPRMFEFTTIPKTATGKIQKFELREIARQKTAEKETIS